MLTDTTVVATVAHTPIATVIPTATLETAAGLLAADEVGLLVVVDAIGVRGVFSERDLVRAVAEGYDLTVERVVDHASGDVVTIEETAGLPDAARTMGDAGVRHLLVTRRGVPAGIVSIRDVLAGLLAATPA